MRADQAVHTYPEIGDASADFAARATQLHEIAARAYKAKQTGDGAAYATAMNQFRRLLAQITPAQQIATKAALEQEMPSKFLQDLAGWSDMLGGLFKNPVIVLLGLGALLFFASRARGAQMWE